MEEVFKSPIKKLNKFFKQSRDKWKKRAKKAIKEVRQNKKRIEFLETSKNSLKDKVRELKERNRVLENELEDNKKKR
jgi:chromosome segregation ATPase